MTWPSGDPNQTPAYQQPQAPQYPPPPPLPYQQGPYGPPAQPGHYGQPGQPPAGYPYAGPPPKRSRKGLIIGLSIGAVVTRLYDRRGLRRIHESEADVDAGVK